MLFLQLPALDNVTRGPWENLPLAAIYLEQALARSDESAHYCGCFSPREFDLLDNAGIVAAVAAMRPAVLACTLYLWNVERTLRVVRGVQKILPDIRTVAGGPEVFDPHPFLWRAGVFDAAVVGEGEVLFPLVLKGLRTGRRANLKNVAWKVGRSYEWGRTPVAPVRLVDYRPWSSVAGLNPNGDGVAYLETVRGCPRRCAFCRYHHLRERVDFLAPTAVARRVAGLAERGAREIKITDPTFNAHPHFCRVLRQMAAVNRAAKLKFFAEVRAETITEEEADLLAAANFVEVEVGMQSRDPRVLRVIRRPTDLKALESGVRRLSARGIKVTLDVMYGLPQQSLDDVWDSLAWAGRLKKVRIQCLQTLLLPGTDLRAAAGRWKLRAAKRPPYGVWSTPSLSLEDARSIEERLAATPALAPDAPALRFVGRELPDLFREKVRLAAESLPRVWREPVSGRQNRRAIILRGQDLFQRRAQICALVRAAVRHEPDILWQFVLAPEREEPLDLLDMLIAELRREPQHWLDRGGAPAILGKLAARRVFILLSRRRRYELEWMTAAEELLRRCFY